MARGRVLGELLHALSQFLPLGRRRRKASRGPSNGSARRSCRASARRPARAIAGIIVEQWRRLNEEGRREFFHMLEDGFGMDRQRLSALVANCVADPSEFAAEDGFFVTGDLGTVGADGYLQIVGRGKDLIISGRCSIYPKEIERLG